MLQSHPVQPIARVGLDLGTALQLTDWAPSLGGYFLLLAGRFAGQTYVLLHTSGPKYDEVVRTLPKIPRQGKRSKFSLDRLVR